MSVEGKERTEVGSGIVFDLKGMFHGKDISDEFVRVNLETVTENVPLQVEVLQADQFHLVDAIGSSMLWKKCYTYRKE